MCLLLLFWTACLDVRSLKCFVSQLVTMTALYLLLLFWTAFMLIRDLDLVRTDLFHSIVIMKAFASPAAVLDCMLRLRVRNDLFHSILTMTVIMEALMCILLLFWIVCMLIRDLDSEIISFTAS